MLRVHLSRHSYLPFLILACLVLLIPQGVHADVPDHYAKAHFDWVLVTQDSLLSEYTDLATHRQSQGLSPMLLGMAELNRWSPYPENSPQTLRWLATVAHEQWGATYLVLGGSHALLPAPLHRVTWGVDNYKDCPTDAYFRCLQGNWDVDGDGLVAEFADDAADPTGHLSVGRLPADNRVAAGNLVAKIIAFEERNTASDDGALFISSLMLPDWYPGYPGQPYPNGFLQWAMGLRDMAQATRPSLRIESLFQGDEGGNPYADPLNPHSVVESLGDRPHDFVFLQLQGEPEYWNLAGYLTIGFEDLIEITGCGHSYLATMNSGDVADTRSEECILTRQMIIPDGGAVGFAAPAGMTSMNWTSFFHEAMWQHMLNDSAVRFGDAFDMALVDFLDHFEPASPYPFFSYYSLTLLGDPATLLRAHDALSDTPSAAFAARLHAAPNPFNPQTSLHFEVPRTGADKVPVKLEIFDLHGRLVETLIDGNLEAGPRSVVWGGTAAAGVYLARLQVAGIEETTKLTLVD